MIVRWQSESAARDTVRCTRSLLHCMRSRMFLDGLTNRLTLDQPCIVSLTLLYSRSDGLSVIFEKATKGPVGEG